MDYRKSAKEILSAIGGKDNLASAAHCATRLRLIIADNSKVQKETLENIDVVKGVFEASGQLQIIIGTGTVNKVYDEFIDEAGIEAASKDDVKAAAAKQQNWFKRLIKTLGDVFVPIIPAIVAGGLIMLGITEPAIFGVNLRYVKPFIFGSIGGACGAMAASIMNLGATATGVTGIFAILLTLSHPVKYITSMCIAMAVAFVLTWFFGTDKVRAEADTASKKDTSSQETEVPALDAHTILSPLSGKAVALKDVPDATFAEGILGLGAAVEPSEGKIVAPADGTVESIFDTHHAIGIKLDSGAEMLIHIGINTVELDGKGFTAHVSDGDRFTKGQTLITFDLDFIKKSGYNPITPVLVTNADEYESIEQTAESGSSVAALQQLLHI